jgi:hypothetical protein
MPPDAIDATAIKGDRVFVAGTRNKPPIGKLLACGAIWSKAKREQAAEAEAQDDNDYRALLNGTL